MDSLISLYNDLKIHYQKIIKPPIARQEVRNAIPIELYKTNPFMYQKLCTEFYFFYVLYAQNTRDVMSKKVLEKIHHYFKSLNYEYTLEDYKKFFYKHVETYQSTFKLLLELHKESFNRVLFMDEFLKLNRVGYKTTALIYNEFYDRDSWPVVDVNVYKGYLKLAPYYNLKLVKSPDQLFFMLVELNNFCDGTIGYDLARLLHSFRKHPPLKNQGDSHECIICTHLGIV